MQELKSSFISNFIDDNRWRYITDGLKITLLVTVFAVLIGVVLGFLIAIVRTTHDKTGKLKILNAICKVYLTVIRGTPMMVQLLIMWFVVWASARSTPLWSLPHLVPNPEDTYTSSTRTSIAITARTTASLLGK